MKKHKIIRIKNPKLINLRNSIRYILVNAVFDEVDKLIEEGKKFNNWNELSESKKSECIKLENKKRELDKLRQRSICQCTCGSSKRDMVYYPPYNAWYCVKCYEEDRMIPLDL
jgi:hypothetical protein